MKIFGDSPLHSACCIGLGTLLTTLVPADVSAIPQAVQIGMLAPEDFAYTAGGPDLPGSSPTGITLSGITASQFPALEGQNVGMLVVNFEPCSINPPHTHPRATEMVYVLKGKLRVAFVEELGGSRGAVINDLSAGDATFFPQGLVHYQQNLECEEASYVAAVGSEDPGVIMVLPTFFSLPDEAIQAMGIDFSDPDVAALVSGLFDAPVAARQECLKRCGYDTEGSTDDQESYVEAGTVTTVDVTATAYDTRPGAGSGAAGCGQDGCLPTLAYDGDGDDVESRWACSADIVPGGGACEIEFTFGAPQDVKDIQVAFWKGDERERTLKVKINGDVIGDFESEGVMTSFGIEEDEVLTVAFESVGIDTDEWISLLEVYIMVDPMMEH